MIPLTHSSLPSVSSNCEDFLLGMGYVLEEQSAQVCSGITFKLKNDLNASIIKVKVTTFSLYLRYH